MISGCVSLGLCPDEVGELGGDLVWWSQEEEEEEDGPCVSYTSPAPALPVLYAGVCWGSDYASIVWGPISMLTWPSSVMSALFSSSAL